jgi:hypothetical protein
MVELPIKFPNEADVVADEAARFRALSSERQLQELAEMFRLYHFLAANSDRPDWVDHLACAEEDRARQAIREFVARHGRE